MLVLEIREFSPDNQEGIPIGRLWLKNGKIGMDVPDIMKASLKKGVRGADGKRYTLKDGVGFLKAIQEFYMNSSYVAAKLVSKKD
jgi:hypothetical protein